jgi:hypothetical protein
MSYYGVPEQILDPEDMPGVGFFCKECEEEISEFQAIHEDNLCDFHRMYKQAEEDEDEKSD